MARIDVNDISPESRIALLNFCGSIVVLERILKDNGASAAEIEKGAIEALKTTLNQKQSLKTKIESEYYKYGKEV